MMIVDTNILIDSLRGKNEAIKFLESSDQQFSLSVVSVAELYAGLKGEKEANQLQEFLKTFAIYPVDTDVARIAGQYLNKYGKSHALGMADALIAATTTIQGERLASLNVKHFPMLSDVIRPY
jgi:predicted nucleic acid-binding protein